MGGSDHEPVASVFRFETTNNDGNYYSETVVQVSWNLGGEGKKILQDNEDVNKFTRAMEEVFRNYNYSMTTGD